MYRTVPSGGQAPPAFVRGNGTTENTEGTEEIQKSVSPLATVLMNQIGNYLVQTGHGFVMSACLLNIGKD